MKRDLKKVYGYGLVMIVAVLVIVIVACLSESRVDDAHETYKSVLSENEGVIQKLEKENKELEEKIAGLEKTAENNMDIQAKLDRHNQIMSDLTEVYNYIKEGKKELASEKLEKIDTVGFDDGELAFYEALRKLLKS